MTKEEVTLDFLKYNFIILGNSVRQISNLTGLSVRVINRLLWQFNIKTKVMWDVDKKIKFIEDDNGCYICISHKPNKDGYPQVSFRGVTEVIHRYIFIINKGEINDGLVVRHTCDNRSCINPEHLIVGTHQDNVIDKVNRNRQSKGEKNGRAKLTEEQIEKILNDRDNNVVIAKKYNVCHQTISLIKRGKIWKHVHKSMAGLEKKTSRRPHKAEKLGALPRPGTTKVNNG